MDFTKPHIYRRQIIATGKYYVGKHNGNDKNYLGSGTDYLKDLKLFVKDREKDLIEEILEYVEDINDINKREVFWLKYFNVVNDPLYYNLTDRNGGLEFQSNETKLKKSLAHLGKKHSKEHNKNKSLATKGRPKPEGFGNKISKALKGKSKHTDKSKSKISLAHIGFKHSEKTKQKMRKPKSESALINMSLAKKGISKPKGFGNKISKALKGKISKKRINILQYDLEDNFIEEWDYVDEAAKYYNIHKEGIRNCCNGVTKTAKGFKWKYKINK